MNNFEKPTGTLFIEEEEMDKLVSTPDGKQQITVRKMGLPPSVGFNVNIALPNGSSAIGKVLSVKEVKIENDAPRNEILLEIQAD